MRADLTWNQALGGERLTEARLQDLHKRNIQYYAAADTEASQLADKECQPREGFPHRARDVAFASGAPAPRAKSKYSRHYPDSLGELDAAGSRNRNRERPGRGLVA